MTIWLYPVFFATGAAAGFVDSIAGGGGLITIPVLLSLGLPPAEALGTNKLQASFGSGGATWHYGHAGLVDFRECMAGVAWTFVGSLAGSLTVRNLNPDFLRLLIPWLLVGIACFMLLRPQFGEADAQPRLSKAAFYPVVGFLLGFYDGFFGPGTGTFWAMALMLGLGFNLTRATANTKLMNFASNLASLLVFLVAQSVWFGPGLAMGLGQWVGARLGARMVIRRGTRFIRPVFLTVVLLITARLLYQSYTAP